RRPSHVCVTFPMFCHARRLVSPRSGPRPVIEHEAGRVTSEGTVDSKSAFVSRFFVKFLELPGAGLASAVCAYCLGQIGTPPRDASPAARVAAVTSPATEDAIRLARDDHALLVELVRKGAETPKQPDSVAPAAGAPVSKPAKQATAAPQRRNQKPDAVHEGRPRPAEAKPTQSPAVLSDPAPRASAQMAGPPSASAPTARSPGAAPAPAAARDVPPAASGDRPLLARLVPSWLSSRDRLDVPRPPMPVGDVVDSAM